MQPHLTSKNKNGLVLVTGADGFVGRWACRDLLAHGYDVLGAVRRLDPLPTNVDPQLANSVHWVGCDLARESTIRECLSASPKIIYHLAAVSSGAEARRNPVAAWETNCLGTARLVREIEHQKLDARLILASTGEVYGSSLQAPAVETDEVAPCSPYAASKVGAEAVVSEFWRRTGADVVIARPFAQAGPGQTDSFVLPAFARRIIDAARAGLKEIPVGNLGPVREFLDVRDMVVGLRTLATRATPGGVYNVAAGRGISLRDLLKAIADVVGWTGVGVPMQQLFRAADINYLVGNGAKLESLGWGPQFVLKQTLRDVVQDFYGKLEEKERGQ